ncbi:unnamed protein product [Caenorhabditis nigoni]
MEGYVYTRLLAMLACLFQVASFVLRRDVSENGNVLDVKSSKAPMEGFKKSSLPDLLYLPEMSFTVGQYIADRYHLTARLGKGSYGEVYKATDVIDLRAKALKTIKDGDANCAEVRSMNTLSATNGVQRLFDNFNLNAHLVLVLELYTAGII